MKVVTCPRGGEGANPGIAEFFISSFLFFTADGIPLAK